MKKDNMRVIATVMGEPTSTTRNSEVSSMLDYAFAQVSLKNVITKNTVLKKINLNKADKDIIEIVPIEDVNILYKKVDGEINPTYKIKLNEINLPIKRGDVVGKVYIINDNKIINEIDLTVKKDIKKCNVFKYYLKNLKSIMSGNIEFN